MARQCRPSAPWARGAPWRFMPRNEAKFIFERIACCDFLKFPGIAVLVHNLSNLEFERPVPQENRNKIAFESIGTRTVKCLVAISCKHIFWREV